MAELPQVQPWPIRLRDWWIDRVIQHRVAVLVVAAVLTAVAGWVASRLVIDSDLRALLPDDHPVLTTLDEVEGKFGALAAINVVVDGGTPEARHAFADALAVALADDPMLREVDHRLDRTFFVEHALYYLDDADMRTLTERVEAWRHYEFCSAAPDVCIEDPDPEAPGALQAFIDRERDEVSERLGFTDYYEREGIDALVVFLRPTEGSANLEFATAVSDSMHRQVAAVFDDPAAPWSGSGMRVNLVGPYVNKATERAVIHADMLRTGLISLLGVIVVLFVLFRSTRAVLTLVIPLTCGLTWSLAATQLALGHLNTITSLISSVLMGLGIDAGIHFLTRARREREHHGDRESIRRAFKGIIAPLLIASGTTASAFVVMATSTFPAFSEFGVIAALGVALCLLAMVTVYPALLAVIGIKKPKRLPPGGVSQATRALLARPGLIFAAVVILTVASVRGINHMRADGFERNSRTLQSDAAREQTEADVFLISEIFGRDVHASLLAVDDWDTLERVHAVASKRHARQLETGETLVAALTAAPSLLPSPEIDLEARHAAIQALTEDWSARTWARLEGEPAAAVGEDAAEGGWDTPDDQWGTFEPYEDPGADDGRDDAPIDEPEDAPIDAPNDAPEDAPIDAPTDGPDDEPTDAPTDAPTDGLSELAPAPPSPPAGSAGSDDASDGPLSGEDGEQLAAMLRAEPFGPEDLPASALGKLRGDDGSWAIFAYPNFDAADIFDCVAFKAETSSYTDGDTPFVGEPTVYATIYEALESEGPVVFGMAALIVSAFVFWQVRNVGLMLITLSPLALAIWWTFGILGAFDLKLTLFNATILPAILGIGVDNGVYLTAAIRQEKSTNTGLHRSVDETGRAILAATTTTAVGFGAFLFADNGGLRSIGQLAVIGIAATAIAAMLAVPTIAALMHRHRERKG